MLRDANAISIATDHNSHTLKRSLAEQARTDQTTRHTMISIVKQMKINRI